MVLPMEACEICGHLFAQVEVSNEEAGALVAAHRDTHTIAEAKAAAEQRQLQQALLNNQ